METIIKLLLKFIKPIAIGLVIVVIALVAYFRFDPFHIGAPRLGTVEKQYTQSTVIRKLKNDFQFQAGAGTATDVEITQTYRTITVPFAGTHHIPLTNGTYAYKANFDYTAKVNANSAYKSITVNNSTSTVTITLPQPYLSAALNPYTSGEVQKPGNPIAPRVSDESTASIRRALTNVTNPANKQYQNAVVRGRSYLQKDLNGFLGAMGFKHVVIVWSAS